MLKRPTKEETEEDLLQLQREFLSSGQSPSARVERKKGTPTDSPKPEYHQSLDNERPSRDFVRLEAMDYETSKLSSHSVSKFKRSIIKKKREEAAINVDEDTEELMDRNDPHVTSILSKIQERNNVITNKKFKGINFAGGFPTVPTLGKDMVKFELESIKKKDSKTSLFARQFMTESVSVFGAKDESLRKREFSTNDSTPSGTTQRDRNASEPTFITGEGLTETYQNRSFTKQRPEMEIHEQNLQKLASMSETEILEEQKRLRSTLDPKLVEFLTSRKDKPPEQRNRTTNVETQDDIMVENKDQQGSEHSPDFEDTPMDSETVDTFDPHEMFEIDRDVVHMDQIEKEKLEWMKPLSNQESATATRNCSARFDFEGQIVPKNTTVTVDRSLYHHGDEPAFAGYSLEELFILARANFPQQRIMAFQTLGKITEMDQKGAYVKQLNSGVLSPLLEGGLPFLIRWAMDENTENLFKAAVFACAKLLIVPSDQRDLDFMRSSCCGPAQPSLSSRHFKNERETGAGEEKHMLTDAEILKQDVVKGFTVMQILPRIRYILEVLNKTALTAIDNLNILIRFAQHSTQSAYEVFKCPRLIDVIFKEYLPLSWNNSYSLDGTEEDHVKLRLTALRLVYSLCIGGKSIARKLWLTYDLQTVVVKTLDDVITSGRDSLVLIANECLHIWRVVLLYGIEIQLIRDMHGFILSLLRRLMLKSGMGHYDGWNKLKCSIVIFLTSVSQALGQDTFQIDENEKASRAPPPETERLLPGDWKLVESYKDLMYTFLKEELSRIVQKGDTKEALQFCPAIFQYLTSVVQSTSQQHVLSAVDALQTLENVFNDFIKPFLRSNLCRNILDKLSDVSLLTKETIVHLEDVACLPNFGSNILDGSTEELDERKQTISTLACTFQLLRSTLEKHKGLLLKVHDLMEHPGILRYMGKLSTSSSASEVSGRLCAAREEHYLVYLLIKVFNLVNCVKEFSPAVKKVYHLSGLTLFSLFQPAAGHLAFDLLSNYLIEPTALGDVKESRPFLVLKNCSQCSSTAQQTTLSERPLGTFSAAAPIDLDLDTIKLTYLRCCFTGRDKELTEERDRHRRRGHCLHSFLASPLSGHSQPSDWMFKPIIDLYNETYNTEFTGGLISSLTRESIVTIAASLSTIWMFENYRGELLLKIPVTTRLARLMCVFLIGSDAFLEPPIYNSLNSLLQLYCRPEYVTCVDFKQPIAGLTSFSDFYSSLLTQFSASSFGDAVFSNYLLLPLQKHHHTRFRRALWSEHSDVLRIFSLPLDQILLPYDSFFEEGQIDEELITLYLRSFMSAGFRQEWTPFFYAVAVHHICKYVFEVQEQQKPDMISISKQKLSLLERIVEMKDEVKKRDILFYDRPNQLSSRGFDLFPQLPPIKELILLNRKSK